MPESQARELSISLQEPNDDEEECPAGRDWMGRPIEINEYGLPVIWTYEPEHLQRERPPNVQWIRVHAFHLFLVVTFGGTCLVLLITKVTDKPDDGVSFLGMPCSKTWLHLFKYLSIPIVSVLFTWWHVWLGIKMCFYPVHFVGCCPPICGWQGIVPRRAEIMAGRSCDIMIGRLLKIEEIIDRIEPESFFKELNPVLVNTASVVIEKLAQKHAPGIWSRLPDMVKRELENRVLEQAPEMFNPVIADVKLNINQIVDVKQMAIQILIENKPLLVEMFQKIGSREFIFVQHFSAVLGFFCGVIQMLLWLVINNGHDEAECNDPQTKGAFHCWAGFLILPVSGLIIGYFTNWLGINLIFRPVWPHIICGGYVNIQGVFLKRQQQVAYEMTKMVCEHLVTARKMLEFVIKREEIISRIFEIFQTHIDTAIDKSTAAVRPVVNRVGGASVMANIKDDIKKEIVAELPNHSQRVEEYMDARFDLVNTMSYRLSRLPPDQFEGMLHPVFQEDEWMVLLLGGVLGVTVGTLQAFALGS